MAVVGIIANPASGKDIRRLVTHATVCDNMEKVNMVRRILLALQATGVERVLIMPDYFGIGTRALDGLTGPFRLNLTVEFLSMNITGTQEDSLRAAGILKDKVDCLITLGGDGTNRLVAKGCDEVPILPVSTGTNNVFPTMLEGTVAGLAAGFIATNRVLPEEGLARHKKLEVYIDGVFTDIALVDVVVLNEQFIGSRAIWDVDKIKHIYATRGELKNIGIVSVVGALQPVQAMDPYGMYVEIGQGGPCVMAALGPGLLVQVPVKSFARLEPMQRMAVSGTPFVIALDGEREISVRSGADVEINLNPAGPRVVDVPKTLARAAAQGLMRL